MIYVPWTHFGWAVMRILYIYKKKNTVDESGSRSFTSAFGEKERLLFSSLLFSCNIISSHRHTTRHTYSFSVCAACVCVCVCV